MRLFKHSPQLGGDEWNKDRKPAGLEPVCPVVRENGKGELTQAKTAEYSIGVTSDCNHRYRKTMEDASVVITDYMGLPGCAFLAVYDGHAGTQCSKAVSEHLHILVAKALGAQPSTKDVAQALASAFEAMDEKLRTIENIRHSGSTAVVAIVCFMNDKAEFVSSDAPGALRKLFVANAGDSRAVLGIQMDTADSHASATITQSTQQRASTTCPTTTTTVATVSTSDAASDATVPDPVQHAAIEARRLTYDHRCADVHEQRRVTNKGGLMINNRVNGMLAVTRSLGDLFMKEYVVGTPYTTESDIPPGQQILVLACDGLWDVCSDDKAVQIVQEVVRNNGSALEASEKLLAHALEEFSVDNLTTMVAVLNPPSEQ